MTKGPDVYQGGVGVKFIANREGVCLIAFKRFLKDRLRFCFSIFWDEGTDPAIGFSLPCGCLPELSEHVVVNNRLIERSGGAKADPPDGSNLG